MGMLKEHKGKVLASVLIAIIGVGFGVLPYFSGWRETCMERRLVGDNRGESEGVF